MNWRHIIKAPILVLVFVTVAGCGYRLSGAKADLPEGIKTVAVPPFENRTLEPDLGVVMAEAMQREILRRGMVKIAPSDKADAVLTGRIDSIRLTPVGYDSKGFTTAYQVRVEVSARLVQGGKTIWSINKLVENEEIKVDSNIPDDLVRREKVLVGVAEDVAEQIHISMVEGW